MKTQKAPIFQNEKIGAFEKPKKQIWEAFKPPDLLRRLLRERQSRLDRDNTSHLPPCMRGEGGVFRPLWSKLRFVEVRLCNACDEGVCAFLSAATLDLA
jgi:hypothetical protein